MSSCCSTRFGRAHGTERVIGFDIDRRRVDALKQAQNWTAEIPLYRLARSVLRFTAEIGDLRDAIFSS